jgi:hypothetical protein
MSIGPLGGIAGSAAGSPLAQTAGSENERTAQDATAHQTRAASNQKAESAAGIGETDGEDHEAAERDADGRRIWEESPKKKEGEPAAEDEASADAPRSKDPSGASGNLLDLSG